MDRNRTPNTAYKYLFKESRGDQRQVAWNEVGGHQSPSENACDHHRQTTPKVRREISNESAADQGTDLAHHRDHSRLSCCHACLALEKRRIKVLAAVANAVETSHDHDHVCKQDPVPFDRLSRLIAEGAHVRPTRFWLVIVRMLRGLGCFCFSLGLHDKEVIGLWQVPAKENDENWWTSTEPEMCQQGNGEIDCAEQTKKGFASSVSWSVLRHDRRWQPADIPLRNLAVKRLSNLLHCGAGNHMRPYLVKTGQNSASIVGQILQRCCCSRTIKTAPGQVSRHFVWSILVPTYIAMP